MTEQMLLWRNKGCWTNLLFNQFEWNTYWADDLAYSTKEETLLKLKFKSFETNGRASDEVEPGTDLSIGQIGHGLGPRAILSYDDSILTKNLQNCAES